MCLENIHIEAHSELGVTKILLIIEYVYIFVG